MGNVIITQPFREQVIAMSKGVMAAGIISLGILTLLLVNIIQNYCSGSELDFYLLRDTTEAAMIDAVDVNYYQITGELRMDKEKFVESFVRRFAQSVDATRDYDLRFYDINEIPPKVSVLVGSKTSATFKGTDFDIGNKIDAILETKYNEQRTLQEVE